MTSQCLAGRVLALADWRTSAPASSASRCWYARIFSGCADDFRPCKKMHLHIQRGIRSRVSADPHCYDMSNSYKHHGCYSTHDSRSHWLEAHAAHSSNSW